MIDSIKNWRETKTLYDQIIIAIDGQDVGTRELNQQVFEDGWNENSPEQIMHFFMFNRFANAFLDNLLH